MGLAVLCLEFFKTGLFAIGGGLATIPFLARMPQSHPEWFTMRQLADMIAVSESTPGPLGINMSTYVGFTVYGVPGALCATFALVLPSFISMLVIARALGRFRGSRFVNAVFSALRPATTGLIAAAGFAVFRMAVIKNGAVSAAPLVMFLVLFICALQKSLKNIHPAAYICLAAMAGAALSL